MTAMTTINENITIGKAIVRKITNLSLEDLFRVLEAEEAADNEKSWN